MIWGRKAFVKPVVRIAVLFALTALGLAGYSAAVLHSIILRHDFSVASDPGIHIFVREVIATGTRHRKPVLLIHGARLPAIASFDLDVAGGSLAADLARRGFTVYILDIRGYGASTRPREMDVPAEKHPPLVRSNEAAHDIGAVVDWKRQRRPWNELVATWLKHSEP